MTGYGLRKKVVLLAVTTLALVLAGCSGSGSGPSSASSDTVNVSISSSSPAVAAPSSTLAPSGPSKPVTTATIDNAWITVYRVALLSSGPQDTNGGADPDGEWAVEGTGGTEPGMITTDITPREIDLLHLNAGVAARFLNAFEKVPAGTYHKIRLYYRDPKVYFHGDADNTAMHGTANFHLDIHFVGGNLVIPVATEPAGGVRIHNVSILFVLGKDGLKITVNPNKILMRPQVFARVSTAEYLLTGAADNVDKGLGTFDISTPGGRSFRVEYDSETAWFFRDPDRWVMTGDANGISALRGGATVDVIGLFDVGKVFQASTVLVTLPHAVPGVVHLGWNDSDNTFTLRFAGDNLVIPMPDRASANYDNAVFPFALLTEAAIVDNAAVTARGFFVEGVGIEAYWISIGP